MDCIRCGNPVERERVGPFAQCKSCDDAHAEAQEEAAQKLEIKEGLNYLTRDGTRASIWSWGKNMLGDECWRGSVEGGGTTCWNKDGKDMSGTTEWDLVSPKSNPTRLPYKDCILLFKEDMKDKAEELALLLRAHGVNPATLPELKDSSMQETTFYRALYDTSTKFVVIPSPLFVQDNALMIFLDTLTFGYTQQEKKILPVYFDNQRYKELVYLNTLAACRLYGPTDNKEYNSQIVKRQFQNLLEVIRS